MTDLPENIYGHQKRLDWLLSKLNSGERIVELGCGTGYMITYPLLKKGFDIIGIDLDADSIAHGQQFLHNQGLDKNRLHAIDFSALKFNPNVVIASEVLEHIPDEELDILLTILHTRLQPSGRLLVTVPNGYGLFECEAWLWSKTRLEFWRGSRAAAFIRKIKTWLSGPIPSYKIPPTLSNSPHVQRFTYHSIQRKLRQHGFKIISIAGSTMIAGPLSEILFRGIKPITWLNCRLGGLLPWIACGFYVECRVLSLREHVKNNE